MIYGLPTNALTFVWELKMIKKKKIICFTNLKSQKTTSKLKDISLRWNTLSPARLFNISSTLYGLSFCDDIYKKGQKLMVKYYNLEYGTIMCKKIIMCKRTIICK